MVVGSGGIESLSWLKVNVFRVIAFLCSLILIAYYWLVFLPQFEGTDAYPAFYNMTIILTLLTGVAALIILYLAVTREKPREFPPMPPQLLL